LNSMAFSLENICLGDVLDIRDGTHDTPKYIESGIPLITSKNLTDYGLCFRDISFISEADHNQISNRSAVESGDILYGMIGTIGKPTLVETDRKFSIKNVALFKQSNPQIHNKYLRRLLNSPSINSQIAQASKGGTQKFVSLGALRGLKATFPSFTEQRRIAAILDQADALRTKRREALVQLDSLTQSIFIEMFGDPATGVQKLIFHPLESLLEQSFQNGAYFQKENYCNEGGVEMVHMSDAFRGIISRGKLKRVVCSANDIQKYCLNIDDILIARRSLTYEGAAKPCMIPYSDEPLIFESSFIRVKPDKTRITSLYLFHYLNNERVKEKHIRPYVTQSTISGINQSNLAQVPVMQPPIDLQQEFGVRINAIEQLKLIHHSSLLELDALFASLQHRAFRGEL